MVDGTINPQSLCGVCVCAKKVQTSVGKTCKVGGRGEQGTLISNHMNSDTTICVNCRGQVHRQDSIYIL